MTIAPQTILVPVDGSENAERAVDRVIELFAAGLVKQVHLVNVQYPIPREVTRFVGRKEVTGYHHDEGEKGLAQAKAKLSQAKVPYQVHIGVGAPPEIIVSFCKELSCDAIVMGTRGLGGAAGLLLGSVTRDVIAKSPVPVTLVK
jgi:nucleotide-binding universal stress UspA family protein